jgi:hypothetical protein
MLVLTPVLIAWPFARTYAVVRIARQLGESGWLFGILAALHVVMALIPMDLLGLVWALRLREREVGSSSAQR